MKYTYELPLNIRADTHQIRFVLLRAWHAAAVVPTLYPAESGDFVAQITPTRGRG